MSNSTVNLGLRPYGKEGREVVLPVDGGSHLRSHTMVAQLAATAMLVPGSTALSGPCIGVVTHEVDATNDSDGDKRAKILTDQIFIFENGSNSDACSEATLFGSVVYMLDDHTVADNSNSSVLKPAGYFFGMEPDGRVRVYITGRLLQPTELADLALAAGAGDIGILDAGGFTSATTVEGALAEIYQHVESIQKQVNIPITAGLDVATGALLAVFADGSSTTPGTQLTDSKTACVRWNNHATPGALAVTVPMPQDLDDTALVTFHALVSKTGATSGDATKLTVGAFEQIVGALHDADTDFGGDTSAIVGNATAKTVTEVTLTLAAVDVHATPSAMTFTIKPKAGTLGTDDLCLHAAWLEYKGKILTS